jgi:hypothetical protein
MRSGLITTVPGSGDRTMMLGSAGLTGLGLAAHTLGTAVGAGVGEGPAGVTVGEGKGVS